MARELAVVLVNGSINSAVALALAAQKYRPIAVFVEAAPSGGAAGRVFDGLVAHFKPYRSHRLPMPFLAAAAPARGDSRGPAVDHGSATTAALIDQLPIVASGLRLAMQHGAKALYAGHRAGSDADALARLTEHAQIWGELAQVTCGHPELEIVMPVAELEPWQVIDLAVQVDAPLELTWSCTAGGADPCGSCAGCATREAAFQRAGRADPLRKTPARPTRA